MQNVLKNIICGWKYLSEKFKVLFKSLFSCFVCLQYSTLPRKFSGEWWRMKPKTVWTLSLRYCEIILIILHFFIHILHRFCHKFCFSLMALMLDYSLKSRICFSNRVLEWTSVTVELSLYFSLIFFNVSNFQGTSHLL